MKVDKKPSFKNIFDIRIYIFVTFVFAVITLFTSKLWLAVTEFAFVFIFGILGIFNKRIREQQLTNYFADLIKYVDNSEKGYMYSFPLPVTVLDLTGNIVWFNDKFSDIFGSDLFEKTIDQAISEIHILQVLENKDNIDFQVEKGGKTYKVVGNVIGTGEQKEKLYSVVLYFIDKTAEIENYNYAVNSQVICCSILLDNYDDLIKNTPDTHRTFLLSEIDGVIENWVDELNGVCKKIEKDRYTVYFENEKLQSVIDAKFDVLDQVKDISVGNSIPATLSIGVGKGEGIKESEDFVNVAMDMALGRGGDQAVIKDGKQFKFFGGHSENYGKNTRVRARVVSNALKELVDQSDNIFVFGHKNADADCFGASVAVANIARVRNKQAYIVVDNLQSGIERVMDNLKNDEYYQNLFVSEAQALNYITSNSLCVVVDTHSSKLIEAPRVFEEVKNRVLVDHHRRGTDYLEGCVLTYHEPYASSACELMTEIVQYISDDFTMSVAEAQAIYAGIVLDTKNFNVKTGVRTFEAATFLRRKGVDTVEVKKLFQTDFDMHIAKSKVLANAEIYNNEFAISTWSTEDEFPTVISAQSADELLNITGVNASFVLCECNGEIYISARSVGAYNVQLVMEQLGGGGHMTVAGAQIKGKMLSEVLDMLKEAINTVR
ncbi:MAG: DHH family phosphoesterase [Clostridia bacterium]|nr:DHH family phosphoesterase [Clostridia bacterium]